ncbi:Reticulocyte-binding protein 2-like a [Hondaea fermentalgiana]|uniref:Reticulocyte-binding protein 2-like a n=1 Tax=Hondaea fermentalgiana TaxID=2315210 RepID=A0A2R5GGI1_9STRA|nr:Reticulocyte-binding protein 2-like a [Hondaea fermentalgiana]|eukprot:GBG26964.1 Reticulocyte-binding protein 2-like a [Hondaea fermentalgiana]
MRVVPSENVNAGEIAFRERYATLKRIYQRRLEELTRCARDVQVLVQTDPVLQNMKSEATTAPFAPARAMEIANEALEAEREAHIDQLAEDLSLASGEVSRLRAQLAQREAALVDARSESGRSETLARRQFHELSEAERATRQRMGALEADLAKVRDARKREHRAMRQALRRLRHALFRSALPPGGADFLNASNMENFAPSAAGFANGADASVLLEFTSGDPDGSMGDTLDILDELEGEGESGGEGNGGARLVQALNKLTHLHERTKSTTSSRSRQESESRAREVKMLRDKLSEATQAIKGLEARLQAEAGRHAGLQAETRVAREALARSEEERLELRQQYLALGSKLQAVAASTRAESAQEEENRRARAREAEDARQAVCAANEKLQRELEEAAALAAKRGRRIEELEAKLDQAQSAARHEVDTLRQTLAQQVENERSKRKQVQERLEETKLEHAARLQDAREQMAAAIQGAQAERSKWEGEKERQVREHQQQAEAQFQRLLDAKQKELEHVLQAQRSEVERQHDEAERVERAVTARLHAIVKDHISLEQHEQILASQVANARAEVEHRMQDALSRSERTRERALSEVEDRASRVHAAAADAMDQENNLLKTQLVQLQREHQELESAFEADRRAAVALRKEAEDAKKARQTHASQLRQALHNIARLREVATTERERRVAAERACAEVRKGARAEVTTELDVARAEIASLQMRALEAERARTDLESSLREENRQLEARSAEAASEAALRIAALEAERERTLGEALASATADKEKQLVAAKHEFDLFRLQADAQRKQLESQIASLETSRASLEAAAAQVSGNAQALDARAVAASHEIESLRTALHRAQQEAEEARSRAQALETRLASIKRQQRTERLKVGKAVDSCRDLRAAIKPVGREVQRALDEGHRDLVRLGGELERHLCSRARRSEAKAAAEAEAKGSLISAQANEQAEAARRELAEAMDSSQRALADRDEMLRKQNQRLAETQSKLDALAVSLAAKEAALYKAEQSLRDAQVQMQAERRETQSAQGRVEARDARLAELTQRLDRAQGGFASVVATLRAEVGFSNELADDLLDEERRVKIGVPALVSAIRDAQTAACMGASANESLASQLQSARREVDSLQQEVQKARSALETESEQHQDAISRLSRAHQEAREELQRGIERAKSDQVELRARLQQERLTNKSLREQLTSAPLPPPRFAPAPPTSPTHSLRSGVSTAARSFGDVQRLLERSAVIDRKARSLMMSRSSASVSSTMFTSSSSSKTGHASPRSVSSRFTHVLQ